VWTILYILIFISLALFIFAKSDFSKRKGYVLFAIQMLLNLLWSPVFFLMQNIGLALFIIILLDIFVLLTAKNFYKISKPAGILLFPYLLWISFATYLNIAYFVLNN
jgi:tryptophan-rich sensory protein